MAYKIIETELGQKDLSDIVDYAEENPAYSLLFDFYTALARALSLKCAWHENAAEAVRRRDREQAAALAEKIPATIEAIESLR